MTNQHPVNILADTITEWRTFYRKTYKGNLSEIDYIAANAAQWGADQELEACCEWFQFFYRIETWMKKDLARLRTARRPQPPSLKEQALEALEHILRHSSTELGAETIRKALEAL